jgi:hypothetical protein
MMERMIDCELSEKFTVQAACRHQVCMIFLSRHAMEERTLSLSTPICARFYYTVLALTKGDAKRYVRTTISRVLVDISIRRSSLSTHDSLLVVAQTYL